MEAIEAIVGELETCMIQFISEYRAFMQISCFCHSCDNSRGLYCILYSCLHYYMYIIC